MAFQKGNKLALGLENSGRKPKYKDEESLIEMIEGYFKQYPEKPTISGLAHYLGFVSRQSVYDYEKSSELSYIIKSAVLRIESIHEEGLYSSANAGHIFWLKNRGWTDAQQIDQNTTITIQENTSFDLP